MNMSCISDAGTGISAVLMSIVFCAGCPAEGRELETRSFQAAKVNPAEIERPDIVISIVKGWKQSKDVTQNFC